MVTDHPLKRGRIEFHLKGLYSIFETYIIPGWLEKIYFCSHGLIEMKGYCHHRVCLFTSFRAQKPLNEWSYTHEIYTIEASHESLGWVYLYLIFKVTELSSQGGSEGSLHYISFVTWNAKKKKDNSLIGPDYVMRSFQIQIVLSF